MNNEEKFYIMGDKGNELTSFQELESKRDLLLMKRNKIFDSFLYRFFSLGKDKINVIDKELDKIEMEIYFLRKNHLGNNLKYKPETP